jgi:hypothetical protein
LSGLSREIGRICAEDAARSFEIMLLMYSFLDEQFVAELKLPWELKGTNDWQLWEPRRILESLVTRRFPNAVAFKESKAP